MPVFFVVLKFPEPPKKKGLKEFIEIGLVGMIVNCFSFFQRNFVLRKRALVLIEKVIFYICYVQII